MPSTLNLCAKINVHAGLYAYHNPYHNPSRNPSPNPRHNPNHNPILTHTAGPTGLYEFSDIEGVSPTLQVKIGETLFFDQRHPSNWFHPLGFAYEPDGAHRP